MNAATEIVRFVQESAYGTVPGSPSWTTAMLTAAGWRPKPTASNHELQFGHDFPHSHGQVLTGLPIAADWEAQLYESQVIALLNMGLYRDASGNGNSYVFDILRAGAVQEQYTGIAANTFALKVDKTGPVMGSFGFIGKKAASTTGIVAGNYPTPPPLMGYKSILEVDGVAQTGFESCELSVENNIHQGPAGSDLSIEYIEWGYQAIKFNWKQRWADLTYLTKMRAGTGVAIELQIVSPAAGAKAVTITIPNLLILDAPDEVSDRGSPVFTTISGQVHRHLTGQTVDTIAWAIAS